MSGSGNNRVVRFNRTERIYHWAQALPYLALLFSGALLLLQRTMEFELVAASSLILFHKICGCVLPAAVFLTFLGGDRGTLLRNALFSFRWRGADFVWLVVYPVRNLMRWIAVPKSGKFNAGQKLHMLLLMLLIPTFIVSGVCMWLFPGALLPWFIHVASSGFAVFFLMGHLFLALVYPATRKGLTGVFSGKVDESWARHHYELEYSRDPEERP